MSRMVGGVVSTGSGVGVSLGGGGDTLDQAAQMPEAEPPKYVPEDAYVFRENGALTEEKVVSISPDRVVWTNDRGLIWTTSRDLVTPPISWSADPELGRGRQTVIGSPGQIFPLREGNTVSFGVRGSSENVPTGWQDTQTCVVGAQQAVTVPAGEYRTFPITCQRKGHEDIIYYAPAVQNYVLRERIFDGKPVRKELVSARLTQAPTPPPPAPKKAPAEKPAPKQQAAAPQAKAPASGAPIALKAPTAKAAEAAPAADGATQLAQAMKKLESLEKQVARLLARLDKVGGTPAATATPAPAQAAGSTGKYGVHLAS
ncbi:MAG: hypothetical protein ACPGVX_12735, partial [Thalassobaculaceae bacterium]